MNPLPRRRKRSLDFLADDHRRFEVGPLREEIEGAFYRVVIGDRDVVAADRPAALVDLERVVVRVARLQDLEVAEVGEYGVDVKIDFLHSGLKQALLRDAPCALRAKVGDTNTVETAEGRTS